MKRVLLAVLIAPGAVTLAVAEQTAPSLQASGYWQTADSQAVEAYVDVQMPAGFQVVNTELEGPVFADANGRTLYMWPLKDLRNGATGDRKDGNSQCTEEVMRVTSGLMSPYPAGLLLPHVEQRPSCAEVWPPVLADEGAEPIGDWTLVQRSDGSSQWSYEGYPLYVSVLDQQLGDVLGGTKIKSSLDSPAVRVPVGPRTALPPVFTVIPMANGRMIVTEERYSVYSWDGDEPNKSNCFDSCLTKWTPVMAPLKAVGRGQWTVIERTPGIGQWAFRGEPLYTYNNDPGTVSVVGSDEPGWSNVYTQRSVVPPTDFTIQASRLGDVLAGADGKTIYLYNCGDDALDQLACDHPDTVQEYRLAICGDGDPDYCQKTFPYVLASHNASSASRLWSVMTIDPNTGRRAAEGAARCVASLGLPGSAGIQLAGDKKPGDVNADSFGEFTGYRNGYKAFWLRDDFLSNAYTR